MDHKAFSTQSLLALSLLKSCGKVADVAREMGMTQSAVSKSLANLEEFLGVSLIERAERPYRLSSDGLLLADFADRMFEDWQNVQQQIKQRQTLQAGEVHLASFGPSSSMWLLPKMIEAFQRYYPAIDCSITEYEDDDIPNVLSENKADFGIMTTPPEGMDALEIAQDQLVAILPRRHPLAKQERITAKDLASEAFIMSRAGSQGLIAAWFERQKIRPNIAHHIRQIGSILSMVESGMGVSILADYALPTEKAGIVTKSLHPVARRSIYLVRLSKTAHSSSSDRFWRFVGRRIEED